MTETTTQETATEISAFEQLAAERKRLALDVRNGVTGADKELRALERRIAELARQQELAALAEEEAQRQDSEQRVRAAAAERQEQRAQLHRLRGQGDQTELKVFAKIDELSPLVDELIALRKREYSLSWELGIGGKWRTPSLVADSIKTRLPGLRRTWEGPHVKDRIGQSEPVESGEPSIGTELRPEPPGPDLDLMRPTEGLRSTRPPIPLHE
jgi:hypothetical protein